MSLTLVLQVLRRRIWIVGLTLLSTLAGALLVLALVPSRYDGVATASIDPSVTDPVSGLATGAQSIMILQGNLMALAKSNQVALAVVKRLNLDSDPASQAAYRSSSASGLVDIQQWLANQLVDHVDPKFTMGSNVLTITYKGPSAQQAALLANAFMSSFIDAAIAQKGAAAQRAAAWLEPQIEKIKQDLAESRERLARFQVETKVLAPTTADSDSEELTAITSGLSQARADLVALQTQLSAPAQTAATSPEAQSVDTLSLASLRSNMSSLDADIAKMQTEVGGKNPRLLEKLAYRRSLERQIESQTEDYRKKLKDRIATQTEKIAKLEKTHSERVSAMIGVQGQREKLASLTRDVQFHQEELERAMKTASQARLQSQLSFSNIAVLDVATPPTSAAFPKKIIVVPLAAGLGLGLGVLLALLAEALDRRLRDEGDLQFVTNAPLLGVMPDIHPKKRTIFVNLGSRLRLAAARAPKAASDGGRAEAQG